MKQQPPPTQIRSWIQAEQNAAAWMRHWGFEDARVTASGSDAGVDVRSSKGLAQVKFEARQVGRPQLQNLVGARGRAHDRELLFFSGAGFSGHAVDYAAEMDIALFEYGLDGSMSAENGPARRITSRATGRSDAPAPGGAPPSPTLALKGTSNGPALPSTRSRWVLLGFAAFFWWGLLNGLFRKENYESADGVFGGLAILAVALLFTWLTRRAFRRHSTAKRELRSPP